MQQPICKDQLILRQPGRPATLADAPLAQDLMDTLIFNQDRCVGMAANMIGQPVNIIAVKTGPLQLLMLNPIITKQSQPYQTTEGCLSLLGERPTKRFEQITVQYQDLTGQTQTLPATGFLAQIIQHEVDHCHGIII